MSHQPPIDKNGHAVHIGARVRLLGLSGKWLEELPADEKEDVLSMIGEVFEVEEIDEHGHPWICKSWPNEAEGKCHSHSIALESQEMELTDASLSERLRHKLQARHAASVRDWLAYQDAKKRGVAWAPDEQEPAA